VCVRERETAKERESEWVCVRRAVARGHSGVGAGARGEEGSFTLT